MKILKSTLLAMTTIIALTACGEQPSDSPTKLFSDAASGCKEIEAELDKDKCTFDQELCEEELNKVSDLNKDNTYAMNSADEDLKQCEVQIQKASNIGIGTHFNDSDEKISIQFQEKVETETAN